MIVPSADSAIAGSASNSQGVPVLLYCPSDGGKDDRLSPVDRPDESGALLLESAPSATVVFAFASDEGRRQLGRLEQWWGERGPGEAPPLVRVEAIDATRGPAGGCNWGPVYRVLLESCLRQNQSMARKQTELLGMIASLREQCEVLRHQAGSLGELVSGEQKAAWRIVHVMEPSKRSYRPASGKVGVGTESVRQPLLTRAEGLAAVALHVVQRRQAGDGELTIRISASQIGRVLGTWRAEYSALADGWNTFDFPAALGEMLHHLVLEANWNTRRGEPPALSLSDALAPDDVRAQAGGMALEGCLAMRWWCGTPGARLLRPTIIHSTESPLPSPRQDEVVYELGQPDLARLRPTSRAAAPDYLQLLAEPGSFRLHPVSPPALATAVLAGACASGATRITGTVSVSHPDAKSPVEFALAAALPGARADVVFGRRAQDDRVVACSGWVRVLPGGSRHDVSVVLPTPLAEIADLHFATRIAAGGSLEWAWADWLRLAVVMALHAHPAESSAGSSEGATSGQPGTSARPNQTAALDVQEAGMGISLERPSTRST